MNNQTEVNDKDRAEGQSLLSGGLGAEFSTITTPSLWNPKLRRFAIEALKNQRLHKARANILVEHGLAVFMQDGRCVLLLEVHDALYKNNAVPNAEVRGPRF